MTTVSHSAHDYTDISSSVVKMWSGQVTSLFSNRLIQFAAKLKKKLNRIEYEVSKKLPNNYNKTHKNN